MQSATFQVAFDARGECILEWSGTLILNSVTDDSSWSDLTNGNQFRIHVHTLELKRYCDTKFFCRLDCHSVSSCLFPLPRVKPTAFWTASCCEDSRRQVGANDYFYFHKVHCFTFKILMSKFCTSKAVAGWTVLNRNFLACSSLPRLAIWIHTFGLFLHYPSCS